MNAACAWARSGLMHLTGPSGGAPLLPPVDIIAGVQQLLDELARAARVLGAELAPGIAALTERAQLMSWRRGGRISCNGSCRLVEARDGWVAVNLPRPSDLDLLPAWLGCPADADPWPALERTIRGRDTEQLLEAADGLGLAVASVPPSRPLDSHGLPCGEPASAGPAGPRPLVVDLSSLWAGPLCAQLLRAAGARVIKVESSARPDSVRRTAPRFHDRLNTGKESLVLDFAAQADRGRLRRLLARADVIVSSARPRAFEQLGVDVAAQARRAVWVAITAHGWSGAAGQRAGFGDDAAAAAGLLAYDAAGRPQFCGDALADPLTGVAAAAAAMRALAARRAALLDVSLCATARRVAAARPMAPSAAEVRVRRDRRGWHLQAAGRRTAVAAPRARPWPGAARAFGADTRDVLAEFT